MKTIRTRLPWFWTGAVAAGSLVILVVAVQESDSSVRAAGIAIGFWFPALITLLGTLIAVRQPKNGIAWLLVGIGFVVLVEFFSQLLLIVKPETTSLPSLAAIVWAHVGLASALYMFLLIALIFPSGRFLSNRQALIAWPGAAMLPIVPSEELDWTVANPIGFLSTSWVDAALTLMLLALVIMAVGSFFSLAARYHRSSLVTRAQIRWMLPAILILGAGIVLIAATDSSQTVANPIGFLSTSWVDAALTLMLLALVIMAVGSFFSLAARYHRSSLVTRAQIRWMLPAILILGAGIVMIAATDSSQTVAGGLILQVAFVPIPLSITIAITRYKLFEIDRIISRTISYTVVVGLLVLTYFGISVVAGSFLTSETPLVVAGSTLAIAALFNPLRQRIQNVVDRRFNRSGYEAQLVSEAFSAKLEKSLTAQQIVEEWQRTVHESLQPVTSGIWIKDGSLNGSE